MATSDASSEIDSSASSSETQAPSSKRKNIFYDWDWKDNNYDNIIIVAFGMVLTSGSTLNSITRPVALK